MPTELEQLNASKMKILEAMAAGANIVKEVEIRGRMVKHADLKAELDWIENRIRTVDPVLRARMLRPGRTRARLRRK